jgi:hypothetical protein
VLSGGEELNTNWLVPTLDLTHILLHSRRARELSHDVAV